MNNSHNFFQNYLSLITNIVNELLLLTTKYFVGMLYKNTTYIHTPAVENEINIFANRIKTDDNY